MKRERFLISFLIVFSLFLCRSEVSIAKNTCADCSDFKSITTIEDLKDYDFAIHIKVLKATLVKNDLAKLTIKTIQIFKGNHLNTVYESDKNTSFEIGIMPGEEWVIFGNKIGAKNTITGGCYHHFKYRDSNGLRTVNRKGDDKLENLKRICGVFPTFVRDTCIYSYYPNGSIEKEEHWKNGMLNGKRKIWYPDKSARLDAEFKNDTLNGISRTWLHKGQLRDSSYFILGEEQFSTLYFDTSDSYQTEIHHIVDRKLNRGSKKEIFNYSGKLISEYFYQEKDLSIQIDYDTLGGINKITTNFYSHEIEDSTINTTPEIVRKLEFENEESPRLIIGIPNMDIIYLGIQNQLEIIVNGIINDNLIIESSVGTITRTSNTGEYSLLIKNNEASNRMVKISAYFLDSNETKTFIGEKSFRLRQIPHPTPMLGPIEQSGEVSLGQLRSANFFLLVLKDFPYSGIICKPVSYTATIDPKHGKKQIFLEKGDNLSPDFKKKINHLKPGDKISIDNIISIDPSGEKKISTTLVLKVRKQSKRIYYY